ncbi:bifunctional HD family hydrolase/N-acetyltransferase [Myxococcus sp. Y35]|uniref:bifunctional HD family hydrolase/N-acetyltransferase n=1 Tax=Pseudomyxococcus flavus TaxID=3115648 RepID=UPI003CF22555
MSIDTLQGRLDFLREAARLKDVLRSGHTSHGRVESTAEHSWRLCLMAIVFDDALLGVDLLKVLQLCVIHDLGEAIHGDIPATHQGAFPNKREQERTDLLHLTRTLDAPLRERILSLWEEYEQAASPEAQAVKALDKLETLLQHTQGANPPDFDYAFNLDYGRRYTDASPLFRRLRALIDEATRRRLRGEPPGRATESLPPRNALMPLAIRPETPDDAGSIERLITTAFQAAPHTSHTEQFIVSALRRAGVLSVSLVAEDDGVIIGHVALSPVSLSSGETGWYGLGPISVLPERQGQGIGARLMTSALAELRSLGASGCVLLGDPAFYQRFGFSCRPGLVLPGVPAEYFQALSFTGHWPVAQVTYHDAFNATE